MRSGWKLLGLLLIAVLFCWGCASPEKEIGGDGPSTFLQLEETAQSRPEDTGTPSQECGDGICDPVESQSGKCPQDCQQLTEVKSQQIADNEYLVANPTSGSFLYVRVYPSVLSLAEIPTLILIPGGTGDSTMFTEEIPGGAAVEQLGREGFNLVVFDPEGRGRSEGDENFNGHIGQDGLYAITEFVSELPTVGDIGYFSQSYGASLASGVLARYPDAPVKFWIDWEGPANRQDITMGCRSTNSDSAAQTEPQDRSCKDDYYWAEREAETFAEQIQVPYHRLQSENDHAQLDVSHAEDMIRATTQADYGGTGQSPWTRLNNLPPNTVYEPLDESLLSEIDREKYGLAGEYARTLFENTSTAGGTSQVGAQDGSEATVYFGFMVHLEGWFDEVEQEQKYAKHMAAALELADVFEEYGAWVTFEASPETIAASAVWDNLLLALQDRGHGIGVHADRGYTQNPNFNLALFTTQIREMKQDAEALDLVIEHVSGICSSLDWAKAAIDAGYSFTTGAVGYCAMSMPEEYRPDIYKYCAGPAECHGNMPLDMEERIHPWRINTAAEDWARPDPAGALVILSSDSGIKNLYEESLDSQDTHGDMAYTQEDIEVLVSKVEEALELAEPGQINQIYFSLSIGATDVDANFYGRMFSALEPFVESGRLEYKTLNEIYHLYQNEES